MNRIFLFWTITLIVCPIQSKEILYRKLFKRQYNEPFEEVTATTTTSTTPTTIITQLPLQTSSIYPQPLLPTTTTDPQPLLPITTVINQSPRCSAKNGNFVPCVPLIACTSLLSDIQLLEKSACFMDNSGTMGVCCSDDPIIDGPSPVNPFGNRLRSISLIPLMSSSQPRNAGNSISNDIETAEKQDQAEEALINEGLTVDPNSPEELHNLITFADPNALQLGKKGLAFPNSAHSATNQSSFVPEPILFSQASFENSPIIEACHLPEIDCLSSKYRNIDGSCNNLQNKEWGKESSGFQRISAVTYADGFSTPRNASDGSELASCRLISTTIIQSQSKDYPHINALFMGFGQFLDHDLSLTPTTQVLKDGQPTGIQCCPRRGEPSPHPECMVINIPADDYFFKTFQRECMSFVRSLPALPAKCTNAPREQMNSLTSYLDSSQIYGSTDVQVLNLRELKGGRLRIGGGFKGREFPPNFDTTRGCIGNISNGSFCFEVGDIRSTEQPLLAVLHVAFLREHNRIADQLSQMNPLWNDEELFQETRRIVIALWQRIIYNEYLPLMLGDQVMRSFELRLQKNGSFDKYNSNIDATVLNEFATAAYRFGHSLVQSHFQTIDENGNVQNEQLVDHFLQPFNTNLLDNYVRGCTAQPSQLVDHNIVTELTNRLFQRNGKFGLDLAAINCQRGRDHGIGTYTDLRKVCGLEPVNSFHDLKKFMDPEVANKFSQVYKDVRDIDLWVGGVVENPITGGVVGPVFACIIAEQFRRLRFGDRFWFENSGAQWSFQIDQLNQIQQANLARVLCDNTDVKVMQPLALLAPSSWNSKVSCDSSSIPKIKLEPWRSVL